MLGELKFPKGKGDMWLNDFLSYENLDSLPLLEQAYDTRGWRFVWMVFLLFFVLRGLLYTILSPTAFLYGMK